MNIQNSQIRDELLRRIEAADAGTSICPSEIARALTPQWQSLMTRTRRIAVELAKEQRIEILRKGKPVEPDGVKGVIRLRRKMPASE